MTSDQMIPDGLLSEEPRGKKIRIIMADKNEKKQPNKEKERPTASDVFLVCGPGTQIGQFRIEQEIGRGGMGVVYLAHDTKLDRQVAIKSIPPVLSSDDKVKSRFRREAKLLASLDHPDIATIHDIIETDEGVSYLVLEYIPGETLADCITRGPMPLKEVLSLSKQIASAFAAAHEHGIVHRDLKPANIKITKEQRIKVLDFGIAKVVSSPDANAFTTVTEPGQLIGTPAYMSPEQARGKPTDERADIWSFGCVLYEMLTSKPPFEAETASETLAGILEREPDWQALPPSTPPNIKLLIRRCLEKEPKQRLQHMGDAALEIRETLNLPAIVPPVTIPAITVTQPTTIRRLKPVAVAILALTAILSCLIKWCLHSPQKPSDTIKLSVPLPSTEYISMQWRRGLMPLALSHDGKQLAYISNTKQDKCQLYIRSLDSFEAKPIAATGNAYDPFFSPDGQWLAFFTQDAVNKHSLWKVRTNGEAPYVRLTTHDDFFQGGSWGDDKNIIFCRMDSNNNSMLFRVSADGGEPKPLLKARLKALTNYPQILPGGKAVICNPLEGCLLSLETGELKSLIDRALHIRYSSTGHLIFARDGQILAVPFDVESTKITGPDVPVLEGASMRMHNLLPCFVVAGNGTLAYVPETAESPSLVWIDREGNSQPVRGAPSKSYTVPRLSPDETELAVAVEYQIWRYDLTRNVLDQFTFESHDRAPLWIPPEGKQICFFSSRRGGESRGLFWKSTDGSSMEGQFLSQDNFIRMPHSWSPDGKYLAYDEPFGDDSGLWILSIGEDGKAGKPSLFKRSEHREKCPMFNPLDGRCIAYVSHKSGQPEVYIKEFLWGNLQEGWEKRISSEGGTQPCWSRDGKKLYYRSPVGMMEVAIGSRPDGIIKVGQSQLLFDDASYESYSNLRNYDVTSDGRFLMIEAAPHRQINVILNWSEELKRLVPEKEK